MKQSKICMKTCAKFYNERLLTKVSANARNRVTNLDKFKKHDQKKYNISLEENYLF